MKSVNKKQKGKRLNRSLGGDIFIILLLILVGAFMILPFIYAIAQSFKPMEEIFVFPPRFFVRNPTTDNYYMLSQLTENLWVPFSRYIFNSVFVTIVATSFHVIFASMAAYPLAMCKFPGKEFMLKLVMLALLFTHEVTAIPRYIVMTKLGMINTYLALMLPPIAMPLGLYLMKQFIQGSIPTAMVEAAKIDGANAFKTYWKIVMPNVKPAWLTLTILAFQDVWNREANEFIQTESLKVLPTVLKQITHSGIARSGSGAAAAVLLMIPPIVTFLIVQSNVLETMAYSGMKE